MLVNYLELKSPVGKTMITSHVTDFLVRVKNGNLAGRTTILAPSSKLSESLALLLKKHHLIKGYSIDGQAVKTITVELAYENDLPLISHVELYSKPGRRFYKKNTALPWGKTNQSLIIISTSAGLMSQKEAQVKKLGGEIFAEIY